MCFISMHYIKLICAYAFICREYCDLIERLLLLHLIIENFDISNMYVDIFDGRPMLRVLLTNGINI